MSVITVSALVMTVLVAVAEGAPSAPLTPRQPPSSVTYPKKFGGTVDVSHDLPAATLPALDTPSKLSLLLLPKKATATPTKSLAKPSEKPHSRQKRFLAFNQKLRVIAVPLSIFNFLGFLPMRVPGLPYHNDLPSPDYTSYNTIHEVPAKPYRYFRK